MKMIFLYVSLLFFITPAMALSADNIPDANLRVAVQQRDEGKLSKGLHLLELSCTGGQCSLSTVSLNQCMELSPGKKAFYPKAQYSATWMGNLKVRNTGKTFVVEETGFDIAGSYVNNFQFDYAAAGKGNVVYRLIGFSGACLKNSAILKKVITIEYVPLPKDYQIIELDCGVQLPGIDRE
jgi:hypothetical protein